MKVRGDNKPGKITANSMPNKPGRAWVRICLNARQDEHGWVYDEYVTEVADGADLQKRVAAQADALLLQAVGEEYGAPLTSVDDLREQRIADSKADLAAWLSENPLTWTDGKKYAVTS